MVLICWQCRFRYNNCISLLKIPLTRSGPRITQILIRVVWALIFSLVVQQHHLAPDHRIRSLSVESDTIRTSCFTSGGGGVVLSCYKHQACFFISVCYRTYFNGYIFQVDPVKIGVHQQIVVHYLLYSAGNLYLVKRWN